MPDSHFYDGSYEARLKKKLSTLRWRSFHLDPYLLIGITALSLVGLIILYSASNQNIDTVIKQAWRLLIGFGLMFLLAQIPPNRYKQWAPWFFGFALFFLIAVLVIGKVGQGARRWIVLGPVRFQPSEIMKLALPMMMAWFLNDKPLPPKFKVMLISALMIAFPALLTAKQPDLGTAIIIAISGVSVLLLAGIDWRWVAGTLAGVIASAPILWHFMHQYQKDRVLTFLNPERAPLGTGYHIIQSKIAIGSGGFLGKGWLHGTQSHLSFLPAHSTDFIFAVNAEEFGLLGSAVVILLLLLIFARCLYMSNQAQTSFSRLLCGSFSITFILSALINIGMVIGILPVVGIPLPLISYGGSSMLITLLSFGIMMSMHTHRKLYST